MKSIKKTIMTLSLATIVFGAAVGLAGCNDAEDDVIGYSKGPLLKDAYIVVTENGVDTLHKGDLIERAGGGYGHTYSLTPELDFNCGEIVQTTQFVAYPQGRPSEDKYDKVCDCAKEHDELDEASF